MRRVLGLLLALVLVAALPGCSTSEAAGPVTITITVADGQTTPSGDRIEVVKGSEVTLVATSDVAEVLHVHGYELEFELPAGETVTRVFTADKIGAFEIETHVDALIVCKIVVR